MPKGKKTTKSQARMALPPDSLTRPGRTPDGHTHPCAEKQNKVDQPRQLILARNLP
jgi:hypothetical protein